MANNYTSDNLTHIAAGSHLSGTLAVKIGNDVFVAGNIQSGTDVSNDNVTSADVVSGKYFHTSDGVQHQGAMSAGSMGAVSVSVDSATGVVSATASAGAGYYTSAVSAAGSAQLDVLASSSYMPTTSDIVISGGKFLTGDQTISGDANLVASNIASGVTIFNVSGTHEGGGGSATNFYKCAAVTPASEGGGVVVSWTGYKMSYTSGIMAWDASATSGLAVGGSITPAVNGVYNSNATKQMTLNLLADNIKKDISILGVTGTYEAGGATTIPDDYYFYIPFSSSSTTAATGQSVNYLDALTYSTIDGVACATFNGSTCLYPGEQVPIIGNQSRTVSVWLRTSQTVSDTNMVLTFGANEDPGDMNRIAFYSATSPLGAVSANFRRITLSSTTLVNDGSWHHVLYTHDRASSTQKIYVDGVLEGSSSYSLAAAFGSFYIGALSGSSYFYAGQMAALRIYTRCLSASEIALLASEFTPTTA